MEIASYDYLEKKIFGNLLIGLWNSKPNDAKTHPLDILRYYNEPFLLIRIHGYIDDSETGPCLIQSEFHNT